MRFSTTPKIRLIIAPLLSHLQKYVQLTKDETFIIISSLNFCSKSFLIPILLLRATTPIEVDSEIISDFSLFLKETLPTILTNLSNIDTLIASFPSDSSLNTPLVSGDRPPMIDWLKELRKEYANFVSNGWHFLIDSAASITEPHKSSFQTIILDDPSFSDLILNSLKLNHPNVWEITIIALTNIVVKFEGMRERFRTTNLVGRMFETVDFVSLPLSESETIFCLTSFIAWMLEPIGDDEEAHVDQYPLIRVSVFEPTQQFITFMFDNSDKLSLDEGKRVKFEYFLCRIHNNIKNMELRSDEYDTDTVSELVKWEVQTMVAMENEEHLMIEWNRDKPERQKRREVLLREEGWDDGFELRVVGMDVDTSQDMRDCWMDFGVERALNAD
ncbi:hypothetical protein BLNAU_12400 [Blattamonas nauphoetae]|uniref:Uncharacterized protein n=1 Tax=Blattamonas nauphoetae TaxID=2049346 RepID=A0ABQ9XQZ9_9EUKA|nr:hypothetical protein BLNAU_12400 [Blattamonas nauphoetae]